ncbi:MAG TPA: TolC family protein, partial [Polyangiaceae bacterium]
MRRENHQLALGACTVLLLVPLAAGAQPVVGMPSVGLQPITIDRCLSLAESNYPKIREAQAKRAQKESQANQAKFTPFSEFTVTGGLAIAPTLRGTAQYSLDTDKAITNNMGLAWQLGVEGALPLYTFGKISHAIEAANAAIRVGEHEVDKERNEVRLNVRRAFYGVQLARDALSLVHEASSRIDSQIEKMNREAAEGDGDDIQILRIRVFRADLTVRESEAAKQETVALATLRFLTGAGSVLDVPNEPLVPIQHVLQSESEYLSVAERHRPEIGMAQAGVAARAASLKLEKSRLFPDLGLALSAKWSYAPEVTDQTNPFIRDNGNFLTVGVGLVMRYKLDFLPQSARVSFAKAQLDEVQATRQWALGGIAQQVREAYAEVLDTRRRLTAMSEAAQLAKQWMVKVQQGIEVGTMDDEDIVLPAREYATKRFGEMMATYEFNVALAKLAQAT